MTGRSRWWPLVVGVMLGPLVVLLAGAEARSAGSGVAAPDRCLVEGSYRLRHFSNGADGWWLRFRVDGTKGIKGESGVEKVELIEPDEMLGLAKGPIDASVDREACRLVLKAKTKQAGELRITLAVAASGAVKGTLVRTDKDSATNASTLITGRRDVAPPKLPGCLHPGIFEIAAAPRTRWKLKEGTPSHGMGCRSGPPGTAATARVRLEALGDEIFVDEASPDGHQGFGRGKVTRVGECALKVSYEIEDFSFDDAKLVLDGDALTGVAASSAWQFVEDGEEGENMWTCGAKKVNLTGHRVGDL